MGHVKTVTEYYFRRWRQDSCRKYIIGVITWLFVVVILPTVIKADESLELIATITIDRDSTVMTCVMPIGDFNADGYPDLAIGVLQDQFSVYEAVYLYFGGPDFDNNPDLIIQGEPQNENSMCFEWPATITNFGFKIIGIDDYNGDGYDDFAVSASLYCPYYAKEGKIYIYFGSPDPDTVADIVINGIEFREELGSSINAGDYNGDGLGDLFSVTDFVSHLELSYGYMYFGDSEPDSFFDWRPEFLNQEIGCFWYQSGFDVNNDNYDDLFIYSIDEDNNDFYNHIILGDEIWDDEIDFTVDYPLYFFNDISGDSIDDIFSYYQDSGWHLCLGSESLDLEPDYYFGGRGNPLFTYTPAGGERKLITRDGSGFNNEKLIMYNLGVPFDTIPTGIFEYEYISAYYHHNIGDLNADGVEDIVLRLRDTSENIFVNIYSIFTDVAVKDESQTIHAATISLFSNYPNPFNDATVINFSLYNTEHITLDIYNLLGQHVETIYDGIQQRGQYTITWDASNHPSGIYFARMKTAETEKNIKMVLLK